MNDRQNSSLLGGVLRRALGELIKSIPVVGPVAETITVGYIDEAQKQAEQGKLNAQLDRIENSAGEIRSLRELIEQLLQSTELLPATADRLRQLAQQRIALSKLTQHQSDHLIGRDAELAGLQTAWDEGVARIYSIIAWGGAGKTALAAGFRQRFAPESRADCDGYLDFSFYQQGAGNRSASSDAFFSHALAHLQIDIAAGATAEQKAKAVAERLLLGRWLLILDGLEPLQYPPDSGRDGELRDPGLRELLRYLSEWDFPGLCILTSREQPKKIGAGDARHRPLLDLKKLSDEAGGRLLHRAGATRLGAAAIGPEHAKLQTASGELRGHPLSLHILGGYLELAHGGDIRRRGAVPLLNAADDSEFTARNVHRLLADYVALFARSEGGRRMLAVLRLLGLFDRAAQRHCLDELRAAPLVAGLNDGLFADGDESKPASTIHWNKALGELAARRLIETDEPEADIDCHPLIRDYFAAQLKAHSEAAWRAGHLRLFRHLCEHTEYRPDGEAGLRPLYQAVVHGCLAGERQKALDDVYIDRILRGTGRDGFYSTKKLGLFATNLAALGGFFAGDGGPDWQRFSGQSEGQAGEQLNPADRAWLLNEVAIHLRALGRLDEARQPMAAGLQMRVDEGNWKQAAISASNLSELSLSLGDLAAARDRAAQAVDYADRSGDAFQRMSKRSTHADALHQSGDLPAARALFERAEELQAQHQPDYPRLYSLRGFRYADLLLGRAERAAWRASGGWLGVSSPPEPAAGCGDCDAVAERAEQTLAWMQADRNAPLLTVAVDQLTLARSALYRALLSTPASADPARRREALAAAAERAEAAVAGLRDSGNIDEVPRGLLTRAWLYRLLGKDEASRADLRQARQIAEAGSMKLHLADIALSEARLFGDRQQLTAARELIAATGYHRRDQELADAEKSLTP